ncbi:LytR/AlgR family response regulator transcription factor [Flagellimonas aequoris]|uniref:DNA-binding response regulator n=1 Tax=Flagellimonas aequoris TaxID=2306997 RepID=A0A418N8H2_9FLAO|nr:LytTR family DNA-binding domain-containing protein [Allomuricauda aequoris]RIV71555.1 DNA-binding response regulator [Allomuricauda aequoris]TXK03120.1 response regulator transcription factor [Allomuricauda aequoris]
MTKYAVVVVDDEGPSLRRVVKMINEHPMLELMGTSMSMKGAIQTVNEIKPDILLIDIQLKDGDAFGVIKGIKGHFFGSIIFITAYDHFALKAFDVGVMDYLLKPFNAERFNKALTKATSMDEERYHQILDSYNPSRFTEPDILIVPEGVKKYFLKRDTIQYICSEGYYANFIMEGEKKVLRISLKKLEKVLPDNFIRINKSTILNYHNIKELVNNISLTKIIMKDGNEFHVSDGYKEAFEKACDHFMR